MNALRLHRSATEAPPPAIELASFAVLINQDGPCRLLGSDDPQDAATPAVLP
jgi:hypothetical protein